MFYTDGAPLMKKSLVTLSLSAGLVILVGNVASASDDDLKTDLKDLEEKYDVSIDVNEGPSVLNTQEKIQLKDTEELEIFLEAFDEIRYAEPIDLTEESFDDFMLQSGNSHAQRTVNIDVDAADLEVTSAIPVNMTYDFKYAWDDPGHPAAGYRFVSLSEIDTYSTGIDVISWNPSNHSYSLGSGGAFNGQVATIRATGYWEITGSLGAYGSSVDVGIRASDSQSATFSPDPPQ